MSVGAILLMLLILILVGVLPTWSYSSAWGYVPTGIVGTLLLLVVFFWSLGRL
jgi:hypothetical protein